MRRWLLASALALAITPVLANDAFTAADTDHDGALSAPELQQAYLVTKPFSTVDTNGDGFATAAELPAIGNDAGPFYKEAQKDGGNLSASQYAAAVEALAEDNSLFCDENADEMITPEESECVFGRAP